MKDTIYTFKLHEGEWHTEGFYVLRVPGGWLYTMKSHDNISTTFVPFNNEFIKETYFKDPPPTSESRG